MIDRKPFLFRIVMSDGTVHTLRASGMSEPAAYWPGAARIENMSIPQPPPLIEDSNDG